LSQPPTTAVGPDDVDGVASGGEQLPPLVPHRVIGDDASAAKAEALADAVRSLLTAGLAAQARPLVDELLALLRASRGPLATVIPIRRPT
jgi:hypothetical protein